MKKGSALIYILFFLVSFAFISGFASADLSSILPADRTYDWTYTGVPGGIPSANWANCTTTQCNTLYSGSVSTSTIQAAITSALPNTVVRIPEGTFSVGTIYLNKNNVTLRGAGADKTILRGSKIFKLGGSYPTTNPGTTVSGATKGSKTFTVSSTSGLSVGTVIEIDRDNPSGLVYGGGSRYVIQSNIIESISGNIVTVRNPLFYDFSTGNPKIRFIYTNTVKFAGIEDLMVDHSSSGAYGDNVEACYGCWVKGIYSYKPTEYHLTILASLNGEVRDSYYLDSQVYGRNNGGITFFSQGTLYGISSNWKVENNMFDKTYPGIELQFSASGNYFGYNYGYATQTRSAPDYYGDNGAMFDDNHGPHQMYNLWEGNIGERWVSDGWYGSSSHGTVFRNHFFGFNKRYTTFNFNTVDLLRTAYYYNIIGNVLGRSNPRQSAYEIVFGNCDSIGNANGGIYRLGFPTLGTCASTGPANIGDSGSYPDTKVAQTTLRWGNYDLFNQATRYVSSEIPSGVTVPSTQTLPDSAIYNSKPSWFGNVHWPPIGPDVTGGNSDTDLSGHTYKIPAQLCFESVAAGQAFNAARCYGVASTTPINGSCGATVNSCNSGSLNDVADNATFNLWQCSGSNGGTTASCSKAIVFSAPTISVQPSSASAYIGSTATFSVTASGNPSPSYQWQKNNANISGATSSSYTTPTLSAGDNNSQYKVLVFNSQGSVTSSVATLLVTAAPPVPLAGLVAYYSFDNNVADGSGNGNAGTLSGATYTTGKIGSALSFDGLTSKVTAADSASLKSPTTGVTLSAWINMQGTSESYGTIVQKYYSTVNPYVSYGLQQGSAGNGDLLFFISSGAVDNFISTAQVSGLSMNTWYFVVARWSSGNNMELYVYNADGTLNQVQTSASPVTMNIGYAATPLLIGENQGGNNFNGLIDEVRIYNRSLSTAEITSLSLYTGSTETFVYHPADGNSDKTISASEITTYVNSYFLGTIDLKNALYAITLSQSGRSYNYTSGTDCTNNPWNCWSN